MTEYRVPRPNVYVTSRACYIVQTETNHVAAYLSINDYQLVDKIRDADAIIITTCAVTESSSETTYQGILECIRERKANAPIYVVGCYTRIEPHRLKELEGYGNIIAVPEVKDVEKEFLGQHPWSSVVYNNFFAHPFWAETTKEKIRITPRSKRILGSLLKTTDSVLKADISFYYQFRRHLYNPEVQKQIWPVIVSKGCIHGYTYCAVRKGRGKHTSKPLPKILKEIKNGSDRGYDKMLLIADEVGTYGIELRDGTSLFSLLGELEKDKYPISIGFWYLDCFKLMEVELRIEELCRHGKIFFLGITLQSGSPRILRLMNRNYSLENSIEAIKKLRKFPGVIIATQIMVGYPTETEEDFKKSYDLIDKGYFDLVEVYEYSPRPGTPAARLVDDVPSEVKARRAAMLRKTATKHAKKNFIKKVVWELKKSNRTAKEL